MTISQFYAQLMSQLTAVAPVSGVAFDDVSDKTKWRVIYNGTPTLAQQTAAQNVIAGFDVLAASTTKQNVQNSCLSDPNLQDMVNKLSSATAAQIINYVQNNSSADAGTKTLIAKILLILSTLV